MESRFGYNFGSITIHTGDIASKSDYSLDARAYAIGNNFVFGERSV